MSKPFSDPIVDKFLMKLSFIVGSILTIGTLFAVFFKVHALVMILAFGGGAFLMLAAISYLGSVRLEKEAEEKRVEQMSIDEQLEYRMERLKGLLEPSEEMKKTILKASIEEIEEERNGNQ